MPSSNTITTYYTFSAGTLIRSGYVNANFSNYRGHLLPIDPTATSSPDMTYNLGGDGHSWLNTYTGVWAAGAQSTPAGNPSTTTQYKLYMKSDGLMYKLNSAGTETVFAGSGTLPGTTKGDLPVHDGSATVRFPVGSNGQVLTADSSATAGVKWADVGSKSVVLATAAISIVNSNDLVIMSGASFTATLFSVTGNDAQEIELLHNGSHLTQVYEIRTNGSDVIATQAGDTTTMSMYTNGERFKMIVSGGKWVILQHDAETRWVDAGALTITGSTSNPTKGATTYENFWWMRVGEQCIWRWDLKLAAGSAGSGDYQIALPAGLGPNTSKSQALSTVLGSGYPNATFSQLGTGYYNYAAGSAFVAFTPYVMSSTQIKFIVFGYGIWGSGTLPLSQALTASTHGRHAVSGWQP